MDRIDIPDRTVENNDKEGNSMIDQPPRSSRLLPMLYYYLATMVGLVTLVIGSITGLQGLVQAAFPETSEDYTYALDESRIDEEGDEVELTQAEEARAEREARQESRRTGMASALDGLVASLVGAPIFFWHLSQARRRETEMRKASSGS